MTAVAFVALLLGCGRAASVIPTTELTAEQKAAIRVEDEKIAMEESQGSVNRTKKTSRR
jgi:hypothetical protein